MKTNPQELININDARYVLNAGGLAHLANLIYKSRTVNIGGRIYITKRQLNNCIKKEEALPASKNGKSDIFTSLSADMRL